MTRARLHRLPAPLQRAAILGAAILLAPLAGACRRESPRVVVYCALDQVYAEPLLRQFEAESGIRVDAVFDIEANKTVGLVRTLLEERARPRCDVFWNNELAQSIQLAEAGVLAPYRSPAAEGIPAGFRDPEGRWTGFAARARVFLVNRERLAGRAAPSSLQDLLDPGWRGACAMAKPLTGTTLTHLAALFAAWGPARASEFCEGLLANDVRFAQGNAHVSKLVAEGEVVFGLTDTDDARARLDEGAPVEVVYPNGGDGTLLIPNSAALVAGAPHRPQGEALLDWLLRPETEAALAAGPSAQIPLRPGVPHPPRVRVPGDFVVMEVDWRNVAKAIDARAPFFRERFAR